MENSHIQDLLSLFRKRLRSLCTKPKPNLLFFSFIFLQVIIQEIACSLYKDSWRMKYEHHILKKKKSMNTKFFLSNFCPIFVIVIWCDNHRILTFRIISMIIALYHQVKIPVSFF